MRKFALRNFCAENFLSEHLSELVYDSSCRCKFDVTRSCMLTFNDQKNNSTPVLRQGCRDRYLLLACYIPAKVDVPVLTVMCILKPKGRHGHPLLLRTDEGDQANDSCHQKANTQVTQISRRAHRAPNTSHFVSSHKTISLSRESTIHAVCRSFAIDSK